MRYFDSRDKRLGPAHVMASGALPPAFPAVRVDGEPYWDGGIYSNTPIEVVLDDKPRRNSLIFAVSMWQPTGPRADDPAGDGPAEGHPVRQPRRQPHRAAEADPSAASRDPRALQAPYADGAVPIRWCGARLVWLRHAHASGAAALAAPRWRRSHEGYRLHPRGYQSRWKAGLRACAEVLSQKPWQGAVDTLAGVAAPITPSSR